ncbi:MAG: hypothetical protein JOY95_02380 [Silvibacterium sp.]|nr:hypothetical protein [Silvibacterium sp.]
MTRVRNYLREVIPFIPIIEVPHHLAHAASAAFGAAFDKAAILVVDGQGESDAVSMFSLKEDGVLTKISSTPYPHSLGLLYLYATYHLGFGFGDEYKFMGMAAYGTPVLADEISRTIQVSADGRVTLAPNDLFEIAQGPYGTAHVAIKFLSRLQELVPPRTPGTELTQAHFDFAASMQQAIERAGCELARAAIRLAGERQLILTGGVALNGLMNERIRQTAGCERIFVYPAAGDDGTAIGAAQWLAITQGARPANGMKTSFYGGSARPDQIEAALRKYGLTYRKSTNIHREIAEAIASGDIVARFAGRSEFGPRALGNRSILADPRRPEMQDILNRRIKHRESFRPFAPACLAERAEIYFDIDCDSPFMLLICRLKDGAEKLIPAVAHKDGTARLQTVEKQTNPDLYETISAFEKITNTPILINTSFNVNGEAIVETVADAIESFLYMDIDYLAAGDFLIRKQDNLEASLSHMPGDAYLEMRRERYREQFSEPLRYLDMGVFFDALT